MDLAKPYLIGLGVAVGVSVFARLVRLDRDRAFYPVVLIVVATYYELFAVMSGSTRTILLESLGVAAFTLIAVLGFKGSLWLVAAGLAAHGVFDFFHGHLILNSGVPAWWPAFCGSYDVTAAACLAWLQWMTRDSLRGAGS
jgi:hypothetical protein